MAAEEEQLLPGPGACWSGMAWDGMGQHGRAGAADGWGGDGWDGRPRFSGLVGPSSNSWTRVQRVQC